MKKNTLFIIKTTNFSFQRLLTFSVLITFLSILSTPCSAQSFFSTLFKSDGTKQRSVYEKHSDISFGIGTSNYYGDLAPAKRPIKSTLQNFSWNIGVDFTRHFTPHFSVRASLSWVRLTGDDNKFEGVANLEHLYLRNAHFRNDVQELALTGIYHLIPEARSYRNRAKINPYILAGVAVFHHNPEAKVPATYAGSEGYPGEWVSLQPLNTEGQGLYGYTDQPYSLINANVHFGAGINYRLDRNWDLGIEAGVHYTFSDYLDDIGGNYANKSDLAAFSSLSAAMGHRENEKIAARTGRDRETMARAYYVTKIDPSFADPNLFPLESFPELEGTRNNSSNINDMYIMTRFKIIYHITPSIKCPVIR